MQSETYTKALDTDKTKCNQYRLYLPSCNAMDKTGLQKNKDCLLFQIYGDAHYRETIPRINKKIRSVYF